MDNQQNTQNKPQEPKKKLPFPKDTIFYVTEVEYERKVMEAAIRDRFENVQRDMIMSSLNMARVSQLGHLSIIVCTRIIDSENGSPMERRERDPRSGEVTMVPILPSTYIDEVKMSPPLLVNRFVVNGTASLDSANEINVNPLFEELSKYAHPFRIFPESKPNVMCRFMGRV